MKKKNTCLIIFEDLQNHVNGIFTEKYPFITLFDEEKNEDIYKIKAEILKVVHELYKLFELVNSTLFIEFF